jgi:hypothetical protein
LTGGLSAWIHSRSLLYAVVRHRIRTTFGARGRPRPAGEREPGAPAYIIAFRNTPEPGSADPWEGALRVLDEMLRLAAARGARFGVFVIPAAFQLDEAVWARWLERVGVDPGTVSRTRPQETIRSWCARTGTPCLDLTPVFAGADPGRTYFRHDQHWTAEGNDLAARALARFIGEGGLL